MASSRRSSPSSRSRRDVVVERSEKEDGGHTEIFMGIMVFMCIILIACIAIIIWYHVELHHKMNENDDLLHKMNDMKKGKAEEIPHTTQYQVQDYIAKNFTPSDNLRLRLVGMVYHYDLHMAVHLPGYEAAIDEEKKLTAEASVIVNFHALTKTNVIEFNAKHLKIKQVFIKRSTSSERLDFIINEKSEKVSVFFTEKEKFFYKGSTYMIRFDYDFKITTALEGLYQANYTTDAGETKTIATSQFEALYARMLAPMFDEPAYKIHHGEVFPVSFPYGRYRRLVIFIHTFDVDMQMTLTSLSDKGVYENDYANDLSTVPSVRKAHRKNFPMSTWAITVVHPKGTNAISNGRLLNNTEQNNFEQLRVPVAEDFAVSSFETTLRMSSYLLAVIVAPFTFEHKMTKKGVKVGISARPEAHHQIAYPLEAGCTILDKYTDMMDVAFPLPKLDMVAIPNFAAGAMENWGLVTYREVALLYSPDTGTHRERARALEVIAHELAHQWFGNLVTMKWWDDLWLNEGFATFIENFGVEAVEPGIERWNAFVAIQERAMESDSVGTASALKQVVDTLEKIDSRFDGIAYSKGASVINMIFHSIGARTFFLGVKEYLDKFALGNAVANDLWSHLSSSAIKRQRRENSSMNLVELATKYTEQAGYPYLRVKAEPSRDDPHKTVYQVTQKRYIVDGTPGSPENKKLQEGSRWDIPVFIRATAKAEEGFVIFPAEYTEDFKKIPVNTGGTIVSFSADKVSRPMLSITSELPPVLNVDSKGHYRVCYDSETLQEFVEMLKKDIDSLTVRSRERLYYDAFACAHIVQGTTYTDALSLFELLNLEKNHHAFGVLAGRPAALLKLFRREGIMRKLAIKYLQSVPFLENKANELESLIQFEGKDTYAESEMRLKMITVLCAAFEEECNQYFAKLFQSKVIEPCSDPKTPLSKCSQMNPLLREIGYCAAVKSDDKTIIDFLLQKYPTEIDSYEDRKMIKAISCTNDVELAQRLLERVHLDADNGIPTIRVQDAALVSYGIDGTGHGKINVDFFFNNFEKFTELFSRKNVADKMVDMLDDLSLNYDQEAISKFENEHKSYAEFESFKNVISKARARKEWLEAFGEEMKTIFNQKN